LRASHAIGAGLAAATLAGRHPAGWGWVALATWPYALSYVVARAAVSGSRVGAAAQSTLLMLYTMVAVEAYRGRLFDRAPTPAIDAAVSVALALVLVVASGHGISAQRCVGSAGEPDPRHRHDIAVHAVLGSVAFASLGLRADLWTPARLLERGPGIGAALISAALPFAVSALFSLNSGVMTPRRRWCRTATLVTGAGISIGYYGGLFGWPLQLGLDWTLLIALSMAFILVTDWARDDEPGLR